MWSLITLEDAYLLDGCADYTGSPDNPDYFITTQNPSFATPTFASAGISSMNIVLHYIHTYNIPDISL